MIIALAQIRSMQGDIAAGIETHRHMIDLAVALQADAVFFPELSLTGYEPALANALAMHPDDHRLDVFQATSHQHRITIGMGMPTKARAGVRISMILFQPGGSRQVYSKQQLHADERPFFVHGTHQLMVPVQSKQIAPAICFESLQDSHAEKASGLGADVYLASVAKSQQGIHKATVHFPAVATRFSMPVLMVNCTGTCDKFRSAGQSAAWTKQGRLAGQLDDAHEGLLLFNTETEQVIKEAYQPGSAH